MIILRRRTTRGRLQNTGRTIRIYGAGCSSRWGVVGK